MTANRAVGIFYVGGTFALLVSLIGMWVSHILDWEVASTVFLVTLILASISFCIGSIVMIVTYPRKTRD